MNFRAQPCNHPWDQEVKHSQWPRSAFLSSSWCGLVLLWKCEEAFSIVTKMRQDWSHLSDRGGEMKHPTGCGIDLPSTELSHPKCRQLYRWQTWGQTHPCSLFCLGPSLWPVSLFTPSNSSCLSFPGICSYLPHLSGTCALSRLMCPPGNAFSGSAWRTQCTFKNLYPFHSFAAFGCPHYWL